jgi:hypothetical protein
LYVLRRIAQERVPERVPTIAQQPDRAVTHLNPIFASFASFCSNPLRFLL